MPVALCPHCDSILVLALERRRRETVCPDCHRSVPPTTPLLTEQEATDRFHRLGFVNKNDVSDGRIPLNRRISPGENL